MGYINARFGYLFAGIVMVGMNIFNLVCTALGKKKGYASIVAKCIYAYIDYYVIPTLLRGGSIYLPKIGILHAKKIKSRYGYDIFARRCKTIPARRGVKFAASKKLKDAINEDTGYKSSSKGVTLDVIFEIAERFELDIIAVKNIFVAWGNVIFLFLLHNERLVLPNIGTLYIKNHSAKRVMNVVKHEVMYMQERAVVNIIIKKDLKKKLN